MTSLARLEVQGSTRQQSMDRISLAVTWGMMLVQGLRRLYECVAIMRPSESTMLAVHWLLSILFYVSASIGVWIEGSCTALPHSLHPCVLTSIASILQTNPSSSAMAIPPLRFVIAIPLFIWASWQQNRCHRHLAGLPKYTIPQQGMFRRLLCPHYTCECLIYASLAFAAAPRGVFVNRTCLSGLFFVACNLASTAAGTKAWYSDRFGPGKVGGKWGMVPFVF